MAPADKTTDGSITTSDGTVMTKSDVEFLMVCIQNTAGGQLLVSKHPSCMPEGSPSLLKPQLFPITRSFHSYHVLQHVHCVSSPEISWDQVGLLPVAFPPSPAPLPSTGTLSLLRPSRPLKIFHLISSSFQHNIAFHYPSLLDLITRCSEPCKRSVLLNLITFTD
jgi:hypothetical protein